MQTTDRANYVSLSKMTLSESTDQEYEIEFSGYQVKLFLWGLYYMEQTETGIPQLDHPKSTWEKLREDTINQVDSQGVGVEANPRSDNHVDVMFQIESND